jgi:8-oxo-dGTP diphosphatase
MESMSENEKLPPIGRFCIGVDCAVFGLDFSSSALKLLLAKRIEEPYRDNWSLPGGFVRHHEGTIDAARRVLEQKTGLVDVFLEQLYTFDEPGRDPRTTVPSVGAIDRIISVSYFALVSPEKHLVHAEGGGNVTDAQWFSIDALPAAEDLSFDHDRIIETAIRRLRGKLSYVPIGFELLERKFTLKQLRRVYEIVLGRKLESSNFRRRVLEMKILEPLKEKQGNVSHRPAQLYRFNEKRYNALVKKGFDFEL